MLLLFLAAVATPLYALSVPERPEARVNDYAGLLSAAARAEVEDTLAEFEKSTSNQAVVAIFPGLEGQSLEDFSIRLADRWKIGDRKKDNGVILLIFKEDRRVRIEVGYGLEGALPDALAHRIIQNEIVPAFREGRFDDGVKNAVAGIIRATRGEYAAAGGEDPLAGKGRDYGPYVFLAVVFFYLLPLLSYLLVFVLLVGALGFPAGLLAGVAAVFALVFLRRLLFSPSGQTLSGRGGGYFGGGFGGGGFSGGGFGGGGGGGFGGGGAGGRW
ncbi:MAG: TPM domain-containing protein [Candidatus Omnitrophica bacterium]|nr:TPM domain-containing protein [Candidatus Omnitrophota bacterium]